MREVPEELDWVVERARCSSDVVLQLLADQTTADIERRNSLRKPAEIQYAVKFSITVTSGGFQVAAHRMGELMDFALFEKTPDAIHVRYKDGRTVTGVLTLGNDGRCRLMVSGQFEWEFWQFRKMILQYMFFNLFSELRQ